VVRKLFLYAKTSVTFGNTLTNRRLWNSARA
jgi:hypothetical protein